VAKRRKILITRIELVVIVGCFWLLSVATTRGENLPPRAPIVSDDLDRESLRRALRQSQAYLQKLPPDGVVGEQPRRITAKQVLDSLAAFDGLLDRWDCRECWIKAVTERFDFIPSSNDPELQEVLFTGYYDPVIDGSLAPTSEYVYPIYSKPADLIEVEQIAGNSGGTRNKMVGRIESENLVPYYSRREIDELGSLRGKGYEIAWVKDPIELFFLHIQGSGVLRLPDGRQIKVGYAGANGRAYRSIGRLLIDDGKVAREEMSMQRLRRYLTDHPDERSEIMAYNESYVFFRFLEEGPLGSLGVPITPGRSIATDSRLFPKGALAFIFTQKPVLDPSGQLIGWTPFLRFALNQDTGGAIRGPQRADLYFGSGDPAAASAGYMNSPGKLYFVLLKSPAKQVK